MSRKTLPSVSSVKMIQNQMIDFSVTPAITVMGFTTASTIADTPANFKAAEVLKRRSAASEAADAIS